MTCKAYQHLLERVTLSVTPKRLAGGTVAAARREHWACERTPAAGPTRRAPPPRIVDTFILFRRGRAVLVNKPFGEREIYLRSLHNATYPMLHART